MMMNASKFFVRVFVGVKVKCLSLVAATNGPHCNFFLTAWVARNISAEHCNQICSASPERMRACLRIKPVAVSSKEQSCPLRYSMAVMRV